mgnify:CR=1 FL=1
MAIILKGGSIFLHIPKTGGVWTRDVLQKSDLVEGFIGPTHADVDRVFSPIAYTYSWKQLIKFLTNKLTRTVSGSKPFMFTFVRHPLTWYESCYRYMSNLEELSGGRWKNWQYWGDEKRVDLWHPWSTLNGLGSNDFNEFVRNINQKRPGYVTELFGWYTTPVVDFIGKQENLCEDLIKVLKLLDLKFDEEFIRNYKVANRSFHKQNISWDPALKKQVEKLEYAGLVKYNYLPNEIEK